MYKSNTIYKIFSFKTVNFFLSSNPIGNSKLTTNIAVPLQ